MKTPAPDKPLFSSALLLVRHDDVAVVDRRALREAGIRHIQVLTSGVEAARELAEAARAPMRPAGPDMVLCHEQLADMTGDEFVRLIRLHPGLVPFPVIVAVSADTPAVQEKARESGYSGLLARPYTPTALAEQIRLAAECEAVTRSALGDRVHADPAAFEAALEVFVRHGLARSNNVDQVYRSALMSMRQQQWDEAVAALQRAARLAPENGEIILGLAAAWRGKNNVEKSRAMLREAIAVFADNKAWERAKGVSERLLREAPDERHPLHDEARRLLGHGDAEGAAMALLYSGLRGPQGAAGPEGENAWLYEQIARGCMAAPAPEETLDRLKNILAAKGERDCGAAVENYVLYRLDGGESALALRGRVGSAAFPELPDLPGKWDGDAMDWPEETPATEEDARKKQASDGRKSAPPAIALLKEPSTSPVLDGFPMLRDAVAVAKVTLGLFRAGKKNRRRP